MDEISGFGEEKPDYERACQAMVIRGMEWFDEQHAVGLTPTPEFHDRVPEGAFVAGGYDQAIELGFWVEANEWAGSLARAMYAAAVAEQGQEPTFAMMATCISHVMSAHMIG